MRACVERDRVRRAVRFAARGQRQEKDEAVEHQRERDRGHRRARDAPHAREAAAERDRAVARHGETDSCLVWGTRLVFAGQVTLKKRAVTVIEDIPAKKRFTTSTLVKINPTLLPFATANSEAAALLYVVRAVNSPRLGGMLYSSPKM